MAFSQSLHYPLIMESNARVSAQYHWWRRWMFPSISLSLCLPATEATGCCPDSRHHFATVNLQRGRRPRRKQIKYLTISVERPKISKYASWTSITLRETQGWKRTIGTLITMMGQRGLKDGFSTAVGPWQCRNCESWGKGAGDVDTSLPQPLSQCMC